jgi:hypothetical protein
LIGGNGAPASKNRQMRPRQAVVPQARLSSIGSADHWSNPRPVRNHQLTYSGYGGLPKKYQRHSRKLAKAAAKKIRTHPATIIVLGAVLSFSEAA